MCRSHAMRRPDTIMQGKPMEVSSVSIEHTCHDGLCKQKRCCREDGSNRSSGPECVTCLFMNGCHVEQLEELDYIA